MTLKRKALPTLVLTATLLSIVSCGVALRAPTQQAPAHEKAVFERARRTFSEGDRTEGERLLRSFLSQYPGSSYAPNASMFLGQAAYQKGNYNDALQWFSAYLGPENPPLVRLRAHQWTASIQKALGNLETADFHYRTAFRLAETDPDRVATLKPWVRLALDRKRPAEAVEHLAKLIPLIGTESENHALKQQTVDLIFVHLKMPQVESLEGKIRSGFPAGYLSLRLAELLSDAGRKEEARTRLQNFLRSSQGHPLTERATHLLSSISGSSTGTGDDNPAVPVIPMQTVRTPVQRPPSSDITVGLLLPLSGPKAEEGQEALQGVQLALQHASRLAERVKLQVQDSGDSANVSDHVRSLATRSGATAILGLLDDRQVRVAGRAAEEIGIPLILPTNLSGMSTVGASYVFRTGNTYTRQAESIAEHAVGKLGLRSFAILYPANPAGIEMRNSFRRRVTDLGARVLREASFPPNATDFSREIRALGGMDDSEVERLKKEKGDDAAKIPDIPYQAIFIPDQSEQVGLIVPSLSFFNIRGVVLLGARHGTPRKSSHWPGRR
jgi:tetratricopeptide (TPR) repeat protein